MTKRSIRFSGVGLMTGMAFLLMTVASIGIPLSAIVATSATEPEIVTVTPVNLTVESMTSPLGIDTPAPRLAWKLQAAEGRFGLFQTAYRILVSSSPERLATEEGDYWDSGWVKSDASIQVPYAGKPIPSATRVWWKVSVTDENGKTSAWSEPAFWSTGLLTSSDWQAKWIGQPDGLRGAVDIDGANWITGPDPNGRDYVFRREFNLDIPQTDLDAKRYFAALRYAGNKTFEIFVNGKRVGHSIGMVYNPDLLRMIDVTEAVKAGKNVVAIQVHRDNDHPTALFVKLTLQTILPADDVTPGRGTPDKTVFSLTSDESWQVTGQVADGWEAVDLDVKDWKRASILCGPDDGPWGKLRRFSEKTSPAFRKQFRLADKKVKEATLFISGLGLYEAYLDGKKIGGRLLDPSLTRYDHRALYSTYDLTDALRSGNETADGTRELNVLLGHGWFDVRSIVTWNFDAAPWRDFPRLLAQLNVVYEDGSREEIVTDETWDCVTSPIVFDCIRQGEIVDGGFSPKTLGKAAVVPTPTKNLSASMFPGAEIIQEFPARTVTESAPGIWIVDVGENIAGWCRIRFEGLKKGQVIRLRYSERVKDGAIDRRNLDLHFMEGSPFFYTGEKGGFQTDFYIANGTGTEIFEPRFSYNGFQFVEVKGLSQAPRPEDFTACVVANGFPRVGSFETSNELLNKIQTATLHSYQANFVDGYPTDCPHREKNGWTGDAHLAAEQAMFNWENSAAYEKWIRDLRDEQRPDGNLPGIVPTGGWGYAWGNGPGWDSSLILIPWYLYLYRGDIRILEENYDAMSLYLDYMGTQADENSLVSHGLGDWCPFKGMPPVQVTSSGYYYVDTQIMAKTAALLGKEEDAEKFNALAGRIRDSYRRIILDTATGVCSDGSLAAQSCAIHQGLTLGLSDGERQAVFAKLIERMAESDYHFDCGIFGAKYLLRTLSEGGRTDLALRLLLQETQPSYADWIRRGAGTLWEDWGDGSSRNHIMFGDVSAWFYQYLAGIRVSNAVEDAVAGSMPDPARLGFKDFVIAPQCRRSDVTVPDRDPLTMAAARVDSPYGEIASRWVWNEDFTKMKLNVTVPPNTHATILIPFEDGESVTPDEQGGAVVGAGENIVVNGKPVKRFRAGAGDYHFTVSAK